MSLISSRSINIKVISLIAFKELARESRIEIIIIILKNIKR